MNASTDCTLDRCIVVKLYGASKLGLVSSPKVTWSELALAQAIPRNAVATAATVSRNDMMVVAVQETVARLTLPHVVQARRQGASARIG